MQTPNIEKQREDSYTKDCIYKHAEELINLIRMHGNEFMFRDKKSLKYREEMLRGLHDIQGLLERKFDDFWKADLEYKANHKPTPIN